MVAKQVVESEQAAETANASPNGSITSQVQPFAPAIGMGSPADIAALIRTHRGQRDPIMLAVHQQRGNAFAQQVIAAVATTSGDDRDDDEVDLEPPPMWKPHTIVARFEGDPELHALAFGTKSFAKGDRGPAVRKLQQAVFDLGYPIPITGVFDDATEEQVQSMQIDMGSIPTGVINETTFSDLSYRLRDHTAYARAAQSAAPGVHAKEGDHKGAPDHALLRRTHTLSADEQAEAEAALTGKEDSVEKFEPVIDGVSYHDALSKELETEIDAKWEDKGKHAASREKHTFDVSEIVSVSSVSKHCTDDVFGSWSKGAEFEAGKTLDDKFKYESKRIESSDAKGKLKIARNRLDRIMTQSTSVMKINRQYHVKTTRGAEEKIIDAVLDDLAQKHESKLHDLQRAWGGSADPEEGRVHMLMFKSDNDEENRVRMWHKFTMLIHEYIHTLSHEKWVKWRDSTHANAEARTTLREGVTELLARTVLATIDPMKIKKAVEGDYYNKDGEPDLEHSSYPTETQRAEELVASIGINNLYAAYFLGKVELAGPEPTKP